MAGRSLHRDADGANKAASWVIAGFVLLAAANLAAGFAIASSPDRTGDFRRVVEWSRDWLDGRDPYAPGVSSTDYPPQAIVVLSPLAMFGTGAALPLWVALNAVMAIAIAGLSARLLSPSTRAMALSISAVLMLPPFRTLAQFSIAAFLPALAGFLLAPRYPIAGGIAIGLSMIKPQIGGPAFLWAVVTRRWVAAAWAAGTQLVLLTTYLAWSGGGFAQTLRGYARSLAREQNREDLVQGVTSLQPLVAWLPAPPLMLQTGIAILLGAGLAAIWRRRTADVDLRLFAAASLISLLAFRHLSYNLLLVLPALAFGMMHGRRAVRALTVAAYVVLAVSPPTFWRHLVEPRLGDTWFDPFVAAAYRVVLVVLFALVVLSPAAEIPSGLRRSSA